MSNAYKSMPQRCQEMLFFRRVAWKRIGVRITIAQTIHEYWSKQNLVMGRAHELIPLMNRVMLRITRLMPLTKQLMPLINRTCLQQIKKHAIVISSFGNAELLHARYSSYLSQIAHAKAYGYQVAGDALRMPKPTFPRPSLFQFVN